MDNNHHRSRGFAIIMSECAASTWRITGSEFDLISERIVCIHMKSHVGFVSIIAVYAPTNEP